MTAWLEPLLSNAIVATLFALLVGAIAAFRLRPAVLHALWLIVLLKFVTPPLIRIELPLDGMWSNRGLSAGNRIDSMSSATSEFADRGMLPGESNLYESFSPATPSGDLAVGHGSLAGDRFAVEPGAAGMSDAPNAAGDRTIGQLFGAMRSRLPVWLPLGLVVVWVSGSAAWFALAVVRLVRFRRQVRRTRPASDALQEVANGIAQRLRLRARPLVRLTDAKVPPMLASLFGRGFVLLPSELLQSLSPPQQAAIIAHELAHFRRGDHWVRWLEFVVVGLYWWHPVAWLARRQLQQAEESCCDAWVLRVFPDQARGYAQALMATVDFLSEVRMPAPAGACGFGRVHSLKRRLEMILKRTWRPDLSSAARMTLIAVALCVLPWTPRAFSQNVRTPDDPKESASGAKDAAEPSNSTPQQNVPDGAAGTPVQSRDGVGDSTIRREVSQDFLETAERRFAVFWDAKTQLQKPTIEERLDRLESMLNRLMTEMMNPGLTPKDAAWRAFENDRIARGDLGSPQPPLKTDPKLAKPAMEERLDRLEAMLNRLMNPRVTPEYCSLEADRFAPGGGGGGVVEVRGMVGGVDVAGENPQPPLRTAPYKIKIDLIQEEIKAKLAESDDKIESLKLELKRAQDQREFLLNMLKTQLKETPGSGRSKPTGELPAGPGGGGGGQPPGAGDGPIFGTSDGLPQVTPSATRPRR